MSRKTKYRIGDYVKITLPAYSNMYGSSPFSFRIDRIVKKDFSDTFLYCLEGFDMAINGFREEALKLDVIQTIKAQKKI